MANVSICLYKGGYERMGAAEYGEGCTPTDANGNYSFFNLTPGFYTVYEELPEGKVQTFPAGYYYYWPQPHYVTLNSSEIKEGIDFGNVNASEITQAGKSWMHVQMLQSAVPQ